MRVGKRITEGESKKTKCGVWGGGRKKRLIRGENSKCNQISHRIFRLFYFQHLVVLTWHRYQIVRAKSTFTIASAVYRKQAFNVCFPLPFSSRKWSLGSKNFSFNILAKISSWKFLIFAIFLLFMAGLVFTFADDMSPKRWRNSLGKIWSTICLLFEISFQNLLMGQWSINNYQWWVALSNLSMTNLPYWKFQMCVKMRKI